MSFANVISLKQVKISQAAIFGWGLEPLENFTFTLLPLKISNKSLFIADCKAFANKPRIDLA
jgi:hypothetical protein